MCKIVLDYKINFIEFFSNYQKPEMGYLKIFLNFIRCKSNWNFFNFRQSSSISRVDVCEFVNFEINQNFIIIQI